MHGGGGHWKAQLRAQWESTRRRANAGAQTDALYADAGAQTTRPAYTDGGAQTLLGADDEDARPAPSYASDDEADARLAARIVAPAPAKLGLVAKAQHEQPPTLAGSTLVEADGKLASARPRPRSGAPPQSQTPAAASGAPNPGTTKGVSHSVHTARSPPPPYAPPASPLRLAPASHSGSGSGSVSASSPSRSRKAMSPPVSVPKSPAMPLPVSVSPSAPAVEPQRERLFIRIPARKRPVPAPAPALEPQTPTEQQLASPTRAQVLVQSPLSPAAAPPEAVAVSGRKRPRARPVDESSPAKRALPASNGHSVQVSEPVAGPSRLNGEHVAVDVRAKRQTKTTKSRVAPLPPPAPATAVSSYAKVTAPARARQWPSLSMTTLPPSAPATDTEPAGPTLSVAEALAAPVVEQARPLVPRKRTRSPSATMAEPPRREGTPVGTHPVTESPVARHAAAASPVAAHNGPSGRPPSPAAVPRFAHTEAEHEQIRSRTPPGLSDAELEVYRELERDVREIREGAWGPRLAAALQAQIAEGPELRAEGLEQRAEGPGQAADATPARDAQAAAGPSTVRPPAHAAVAHAATDSMQPPPDREQATSPKRAPTSASAGPSTASPARPKITPAAVARAALDSMRTAAHSPPIREQATPPKRAPTSASAAPAPSVSSSPARPKITLRLKLPRAPSPPPPAKSPVRDKTESPIGMCFPSPPAPAPPALSRAVPPELLAAFGGPGEEDEEATPAPAQEARAQVQHSQMQRSRQGTPAPASEPARLEPAAAEQSLALSAARADARQDDAPRERSPARAESPLPLLLDPAVLADAHARTEQEDVLRQPAPRPASAVGVQGSAGADIVMGMYTAEDGAPARPGSPPSYGTARAPSGRADSPDPATARADSHGPLAALSSQDAEEDADMNMAEDGAPARPLSATPPRAAPLADSPEAVSVASPQGTEAASLDMNMGMAEDDAPSPLPANDAPSPPPAVPNPTAPRKRARTPSLEQRALSSPRRSSTPASPSPLLPHSPSPVSLSPPPHPLASPPQALRSSPQPDPSPKSGPMSPPWSPVALPDEMMQLLMLGGEPLPMPVFDPLPPPPAPDEEDEFNSGVEDEVERMLAVAPPPAEPAGEEGRQVKKRRRRASGRKKSRALVGDSD